MKTLTLATLLLAATSVTAAAEPVHGDVELDPTAYALSGNSIHAGLGIGHLRLDLGNFAMAVPQFVHGDDGFDVSFDGFGAKLQYYRSADQTGWFAGVGVDAARVHVHLQGSDMSTDDHQVGVGIEAGYMIALPAGFYVKPWLGVGYDFGADNVMLGGKTYQANPINVFPAVHLGYRFR